MATGVIRRKGTVDEDDREKPVLGQGVGGLLMLAGAGLIFSESSTDASAVGGGLGFLLLLVGAGLMTRQRQAGNPSRELS